MLKFDLIFIQLWNYQTNLIDIWNILSFCEIELKWWKMIVSLIFTVFEKTNVTNDTEKKTVFEIIDSTL